MLPFTNWYPGTQYKIPKCLKHKARGLRVS